MRLLLFLYPWLELLSLIQLGIETNAFVPIAWVLGMIILGSTMIRRVGTASVIRLREAQQSGILQQHLLLDDMAVAVAALMLIIPGLVSDVFALIILIGPLRRRLARLLGGGQQSTQGFGGDAGGSRYTDQGGSSDHAGATRGRANVTLEGDFERVDDGTDGEGKG